MSKTLPYRLAFVALVTCSSGCGSPDDSSPSGASQPTALAGASTGGSTAGSNAGWESGSGSSAAGATAGSSAASGSGVDATAGSNVGATGTSGSAAGFDAGAVSGSGAGSGGATGVNPDSEGGCLPPFASGVNVAWINFARDIPFSMNQVSPLPAFQALFANTFSAGGRVVRWWLHTNGTVTPGYDQNGMAQALPAQDIADIESVLAAAHAAGVKVDLSLWSFDMLQGPGSGETIPTATLNNNQLLLTADANRNAYINNVLIPLANALKGNPGLYSWEIFNEPEGMTPSGWTGSLTNKGLTVSESAIQQCVNLFAAAIHSVDPAALVTSGAVNLGYLPDYSNANLIAAGQAAGGTLDFFEAHYYESNGTRFSPFVHTAASFGLPDSKAVVIGEFYALTTDGVQAANTYTSLYSQGYAGAWAWQYESNDPTSASNGGQSTKWPAMQVPMQNLFAAAPTAINCP